jgi:hypothetical protein
MAKVRATIGEPAKIAQQDAMSAMHAATEASKKLGLDVALLALYDEVKYFPGWFTQPDWSKRNRWAVEDVEGKEGNRTTEVRFRRNGIRYEFEWKEHIGFGDDFPSSDLTLSIDGQQVVKHTYSLSVDHLGFSDWRPGVCTGLKLGHWITDIVEWHERLLTSEAEYSAKSNKAYAASLLDKLAEFSNQKEER